jgi:hypothetical protein
MFSLKNPLYTAVSTAFAAIAFTLIFGVLSAQAQQVPLPLGNVNPRTIKHMQACPAAYYPGMDCFSGMVQDCANASDIGLVMVLSIPEETLKAPLFSSKVAAAPAPIKTPVIPQNISRMVSNWFI